MKNNPNATKKREVVREGNLFIARNFQCTGILWEKLKFWNIYSKTMQNFSLSAFEFFWEKKFGNFELRKKNLISFRTCQNSGGAIFRVEI